MPADLFHGYTKEVHNGSSGAKIFVRQSPQLEDSSRGQKPPLLLLHGFPQTHVEFHTIAPKLEEHFSLVLLDLRGYGESSSPASTNGSGYTFRLMAQDCTTVMATLGYTHFSILGHDRGARVAYRLALDNPRVLKRIVVLDIIPTASMFAGFGNTPSGLRGYHWLFLAQPEPFPETMIAAADGGRVFLEHTLASWTAKRDLSSFSEDSLQHYREAYCNENRIHTTCEDYRAGAMFDRVHDEEDLAAGKKIPAAVPVLAVWGEKGLFAEGMKIVKKTPLDEWTKYCENLTGIGLPCGHFVPEEDPDGTIGAVLPFLLKE